MERAIPGPSEIFDEAGPALQPLVETLNARLKAVPLNLPAIKQAMMALFEFLSSPLGRTHANCCAANAFFFYDEVWKDANLPDPYQDVFAHTDVLHDTITAPDIARNFDGAPEQLLARVRRL